MIITISREFGVDAQVIGLLGTPLGVGVHQMVLGALLVDAADGLLHLGAGQIGKYLHVPGIPGSDRRPQIPRLLPLYALL